VSTREVSTNEYKSLAELRYQIRRFLCFSEDRSRAAGIEPRQHQLLLALRGLPEGEAPTIGALAERLMIKHHSAVELVDRLARAGLVRRMRPLSDRRQAHVTILPRGEEVLRDLSVAHREELRRSGPALIAVLQEVLA
jgi:DNA-binding MarR family transcriptional regulator